MNIYTWNSYPVEETTAELLFLDPQPGSFTWQVSETWSSVLLIC